MAIFACIFYTQELSIASPQESNMSISPQVLFDDLKRSTVSVLNTIPTNLFNPQIQNLTELGTGYVFGNNGHIITAYHLLSGATNVDVISSEGERYPATLVGADPFSDVAVLKANSTVLDQISTMPATAMQNQNSAANDTLRPGYS
jgi:S1-C subfamily serine protease